MVEQTRLALTGQLKLLLSLNVHQCSSMMDDVQMTDDEEFEEDKENKPPPPASMFSYTNISAQILKFLPKSFNTKRKRTSEDEDESSDKKGKKLPLLSFINSTRVDNTNKVSTLSQSKSINNKDEDSSSQYLIYMSQREPFDI